MFYHHHVMGQTQMSKDKEREGCSRVDENQKRPRKRTATGDSDSSGCGEIEVSGDFDGGLYGDERKKSCLSENGNGTADVSVDVVKAQDADYSYVPWLNDEIALLILARVPRSEYRKLCLVNRRYRSLVRSGELYGIRKEIGIKEASVLMLASGEPNWWSYDPRSGSRHNLPVLPSDSCFFSSDKETLCAGTHLLVSGKEIGGSVIWRYELASDRWFRGPLMLSPRCLYASANCGSVACVAGGIGEGSEILNTAEKYDPETKSWNSLPRMIQKRKLCSGCYMDNKFYVMGGQNEEGDNLTCAEFYDLDRKMWEAIPGMLKDDPSWSSRSPPLVAVVSNELYWLEASTNQLKVYQKRSNSWKDLGEAPVRADHNRGWGVAFKSLGDELLVIGSSRNTTHTCRGRGMTICVCRPDPGPASDVLQWRVLESDGDQWSSFIFNCSIMVA